MNTNTYHPPDIVSELFTVAVPAHLIEKATHALNGLCVTLEELTGTAHSRPIVKTRSLLERRPHDLDAIRKAWSEFQLPVMADDASVDYERAECAMRALLNA